MQLSALLHAENRGREHSNTKWASMSMTLSSYVPHTRLLLLCGCLKQIWKSWKKLNPKPPKTPHRKESKPQPHASHGAIRLRILLLHGRRGRAGRPIAALAAVRWQQQGLPTGGPARGCGREAPKGWGLGRGGGLGRVGGQAGLWQPEMAQRHGPGWEGGRARGHRRPCYSPAVKHGPAWTEGGGRAASPFITL